MQLQIAATTWRTEKMTYSAFYQVNLVLVILTILTGKKVNGEMGKWRLMDKRTYDAADGGTGQQCG